MTTNKYSGVKVLEVKPEIINKVYADGSIDLWTKQIKFYPHMFVYLKSELKDGQGVICRVDHLATKLLLIKDKKLRSFGVRPKNKEQVMAMSALLDDDIPLCVMTGRAGTGKTLLAMSAGLQKVEDGQYDRIIITRPMSQVGRYDLGALPGDVNEKFGPYLENYLTNITQMVGNDRRTATDLMQQFNIEAMPLQLIRGASWTRTFIIADEVQVLDYHEMLTLGTRIGADSKLVVMGDLKQRDEKIAQTSTGLYKIMNDKKMKESPLTSAIELWKCERSELAQLFAEVFEE